MKRMILDKVPVGGIVSIQGVAYDGKLDVIVDDEVKEPTDALYVAQMDEKGIVTELKKAQGFELQHQFMGWEPKAQEATPKDVQVGKETP